MSMRSNHACFRVAVTAAVLAAWLPVAAGAVTIAFEGVAAEASLEPVSPAAPYTESGFTITPSDTSSAIFDSASPEDFPGDATDWLGFAESNVLTLTFSGGTGVFDLTSVLIGPSSVGGGLVDVSIDGVLDGGGTLDASFLGLTTATTANLSWTGLTSVTFATTDDAGLDDLLAVPQPGALALVTLGVAALAFGGRHRPR